MGILLLSECLPYRNAASDSFDNSQGRLLATMAGLTVNQLETLAECRYVLPRFVGQWGKHARYLKELEDKLKKIMTAYKDTHKKYLTNHAVFLVGKRMPLLLGFKSIEFWQIHFWEGIMFHAIPNPLAEYYWKEESNMKQAKLMMGQLVRRWSE